MGQWIGRTSNRNLIKARVIGKQTNKSSRNWILHLHINVLHFVCILSIFANSKEQRMRFCLIRKPQFSPFNEGSVVLKLLVDTNSKICARITSENKINFEVIRTDRWNEPTLSSLAYGTYMSTAQCAACHGPWLVYRWRKRLKNNSYWPGLYFGLLLFTTSGFRSSNGGR